MSLMYLLTLTIIYRPLNGDQWSPSCVCILNLYSSLLTLSCLSLFTLVRNSTLGTVLSHSPSLNGIATNGTQAMLHGSGLPLQFWAEAMGTFMYLLNCTPMVTNAPYELFYRIKPDMEHIHTFKCMVNVMKPTLLPSSLHFYNHFAHHKSYLCYDVTLYVHNSHVHIMCSSLMTALNTSLTPE